MNNKPEPERDDLTGRRFNRITVVGQYDPTRPISTHNDRWWCLCSCSPDEPNRRFAVYRSRLLSGSTQSCGCLARQRLSEGRTTHGMCSSRTPHHLYSTWEGMISRCNNLGNISYKYYGARGIKVCERWRDFKNFVDDMEPSWQAGLTLDRSDTDKDYSPDNCLWATPTDQQNNRRCCHRITIGDETKTVTQWARQNGLKVETVFARLRLGWTEKNAVSTPAVVQQDNGPIGDLTFNGKTQSVIAWSKELGIKDNVLYLRIKAGWSHEKILTTPVRKMRPRGESRI